MHDDTTSLSESIISLLLRIPKDNEAKLQRKNLVKVAYHDVTGEAKM